MLFIERIFPPQINLTVSKKKRRSNPAPKIDCKYG